MSRTAKSLAACAAALLSSCRAASPEACAACLAVTGHYSETAESATVDCGDRVLAFGGASGPVSLGQTASSLSVRSAIAEMSGVLHEDGSATFGPIPSVASAADGTGMVDPMGKPIPGKLSLEGFFIDSAGKVASFAGTYVFVADDDGCELDWRAAWKR